MEYQTKDSENPGNGFDIIDSAKWINYPKGAQRLIFVAAVSRLEPKVDLFQRTAYDETGNPVNSVLEQRPKETTLVQLLRDVYGAFNDEEQQYVDLVIAHQYTKTSPDGIFYVPKTVSRGEDKGKEVVQRRENISVMPLVVFTTATQSVAKKDLVSEEA